MIIVYYDGSALECETIEMCNDGKNLIVDDYRIVSLIEIVRIIAK